MTPSGGELVLIPHIDMQLRATNHRALLGTFLFSLIDFKFASSALIG